ncbi:polyketide synthase dehydratase domain-containing protein, partial [Streptomyces griseicoloratus]|uniref:polyketide synthase dehydratase domain-containing protein n=1 Tax=Streptomyces griseicoloratus TaxID=2752516 RepID=UPI002811A23F
MGGFFARGGRVDWQRLFGGSWGEPVDLPTYAFRRDRYWLDATEAAADASGFGLHATDHPILGATVELADGDHTLFTSRLSLATHPWLADHAVAGTTLLPGTGFVDLAVRAGEQLGCPRLEELTLSAPLVLPEQGGVQVQVVVRDADGTPGDGHRAIEVYSRREGDAGGDAGPWTLHAKGALAPAAAEDPGTALVAWPPAGATEVGLTDVYQRLAGQDYAYGAVFRGLRRVWRGADGELFAEVSLPEEVRGDAGRFLLHPALLDAALHPLL